MGPIRNPNKRNEGYVIVSIQYTTKNPWIFIIEIELQYQYLNYITGISVLYKIWKKIHNTGTNFYTSIVHNSVNTSIPVLRSPSTGDTFFS